MCADSSGAMVLWCHTVTSSVQGSTMSTTARTSRLFGISTAGGAHSSSLPEQQRGQERGGAGRHTVTRTGEKRTGMGRTGQTRGQQRSRVLASRPYRRSEPTHCGCRLAESSQARVSVSEGVAARAQSGTLQGAYLKESRSGWPETWGGQASRRAGPAPGCLGGARTSFSRRTLLPAYPGEADLCSRLKW